MDAFDRKLLTNDELDTALGDLVGKMIICDLSGRDGQDFRIGKVTRKIDSDNICVHYYDTHHKHRTMSQRGYFPAWKDKHNKDTYSNDQPNNTSPRESFFSASEIMFTPFSLTDKNHVPHEIVERLQLAGCLCLVADFTKSPNDDVYDEDGEERGTKRKKAPAVPS